MSVRATALQLKQIVIEGHFQNGATLNHFTLNPHEAFELQAQLRDALAEIGHPYPEYWK